MTRLLPIAALALSLGATPAFAAKHCVGKDKKEISVSGSTSKAKASQCHAAGGKWVSSSAKKTTTKAK